MKFAIIFGDNYPGTANELSGCVNDGKYWETVVTNMKFDHMNVLYDQQCTKQRMRDTLISVLELAKPKDLVAVCN